MSALAYSFSVLVYESDASALLVQSGVVIEISTI